MGDSTARERGKNSIVLRRGTEHGLLPLNVFAKVLDLRCVADARHQRKDAFLVPAAIEAVLVQASF